MNRVLPLLRPDDVQVESAIPSSSRPKRRTTAAAIDQTVNSTQNNTPAKVRQGSLSTNLRRYGSMEEPDLPTKKFDDSSSEDESKKSSKKTSPKKSSSRKPSLARALSPAFIDIQESEEHLPKMTNPTTRKW
ncbi:unnamed protein product [Caenorhabditis angaria]|uniref:Uncharacterized protein n=1 Tax=Caenorhabditis angaria TaxID=860376 RepID=A0A9P1IUD1_9PELO|nr:unnamed protein product [Caenorhabditis angaria]